MAFLFLDEEQHGDRSPAHKSDLFSFLDTSTIGTEVDLSIWTSFQLPFSYAAIEADAIVIQISTPYYVACRFL